MEYKIQNYKEKICLKKKFSRAKKKEKLYAQKHTHTPWLWQLYVTFYTERKKKMEKKHRMWRFKPNLP